MAMKEMLKLTGLWVNETKDGNQMMSGYLSNARILILKNREKVEGSREHDYFMFLVPAPPKKKPGVTKEPAQEIEVPGDPGQFPF
jgi:hypothetical protein